MLSLKSINRKLVPYEKVRDKLIIPGTRCVVTYYSSLNRKQLKTFTGVCVKVSKSGHNCRYTLRYSLKDTTIFFSFFLEWNLLVNLFVIKRAPKRGIKSIVILKK